MMDYRKIIKNRKLRMRILRLLSFVPDRVMIPLQYYIQLGRFPNLNNPQRYTEKLQIYKMKYRNPLMVQCVDKYEVRDYIKTCGLESILIPCYGIYNSVGEIPFDKFPNQFVIKTTDGSGGCNVLICRDKEHLNLHEVREKLSSWNNFMRNNPGREWAYSQIKRTRFIVEKFVESEPNEQGLVDYKFFCFNGKCEMLYVISDRNLGVDARFGVFSRSFEKMDVCRNDERPMKRSIPKPANFEKMIKYAELLSKPFPHVRVDLYNVNGNIMFGELTFYDGSGYFSYTPDSFDFELGSKFDLASILGGGCPKTLKQQPCDI